MVEHPLFPIRRLPGRLRPGLALDDHGFRLGSKEDHLDAITADQLLDRPFGDLLAPR